MRKYALWTCQIFCAITAFGQQGSIQNERSGHNAIDSLNKNRLIWATAGVSTAYATASIVLYQSWYKQYPKSHFHFKDDWGQWQHMDKLGHVYSAYIQTKWGYQIARWTGLNKPTSLVLSAAASTLFQSTIEVMDGFSEHWGFSATDWLANGLGTGSFIVQEGIWDEQRILFKFSSWPRSYDDSFYPGYNLESRTSTLFGDHWTSRILKDYNRQTIWMSFRPVPRSVTRWPAWLHLAVGYGAQNMYGGYENHWDNGVETVQLDKDRFPRYEQFYVSLDINFSKIPARNPFLRTVLDILNVLKMPFSALEINSRGQVVFHWIHF